MPKEAKPRKDPRRASRPREPRAAKEAARDASHASHASRGVGELGGRGFRRWTSFVICLLGIQALAVLSLWRSGDRLPPSEKNSAPNGSPAPEAARSNGQVFLGTAPLAAPPAKPAPLGPEFTGPAAEEGDIAVLLIASGRSVSSLQQTLRSLLRGFSASSILVSQAAPGEASREAAAELGVAWVGPSPMADFATFDGEAEPWLHYGRSLEHAATKHFAGQSFRSLFVAEEDLIFSSGLFSFLAQLHPLLFEDDSLWCISAWNDYSLAPFASDVSSVLRSTWFSGRAWMVTLRRIREELLPNWSLQQRWRPLLRQWALAASKECLLPEVSRVAFTNYQCEGVGIRGHCDEEEVDARRRAVSAIFAPRKLGQLGEVGRLKKEKFVTLLGSSWPRNGGLRSAVAVTSVNQLYEETATPLLLLIDDQKEPGAWEPVLDYFGLPAAPDRGPRNSFRGVVRLRWRETVLYLASSNSPLRSEYFPKAMPISSKEFQLLPGSGVYRSTGLLPPAFLAPWSRPSVADVGVSCLLHCASRGEVCVDADLAYVGKCAPPLTDLLRCFSCIDKAESSVPGFPGLQMRSETCFGSVALPNLPSSRHSTCSAQDDGVQRLCVCRSHGQASDLQSASSQFLVRQKEPQRSRASSATKERRSRPNLQRFGELLQAGSIPNSVLTPLDLSILLIAPDAASESLLQRTLSSLSETQGFAASTVLLAHSQPKLFIAQLAEHFQVQRLQVDIDKRIKRDPDRLSALYKAAFEGFPKTNLPKVRFVLVLTIGDLLAPDALWYFSQLADVLQRDDSLLAANGWNDQALAPYAADPTVVLRTDWFSGSGWLATHEVMQEMLSQWHLGSPWDAMFRDERLRKKRQFLTPEVSRVIPDRGWVLDDGETGHHSAARARLDPHLFAQTPLCDVPVVDLGALERLMEEPYKRLFFIEWPGEGLLKTKLLSSLQSLLEGKVNSGGPFRLVYRNLDPESDTTWKGVAQFFNLWPDLPMRGAYYGIVRLRWRDTVLYLVPNSSPLCRGEVREALLRPEEDAVTGSVLPPTASQILDPMLFPLASHPLLVPASSELLPADFPGTSCSFVCEEAGLRCHPEDLAFINNCAALASLGCRRCEADQGPDQPAQELQGPKAGRCLYNGNLGQYPLSCDASHLGTRRLCICREPVRLAAAVKRKVISSSPSPQLASLSGNGTTQVDQGRVVLPAALRDLKPQDLAVLVVAGGQRPRMLERCLQALSKAYGYNKNMVMVSQDGDGTQTKIMAQKFHVGWRQVDTGVKSAGEKEALHYKMALQHAIEGPIKDKSVLIILEEDMVVSFDILLYFAQFQEILKWDDIFSVSAWNENAIAPFSANAQRLLRVDSFSGAAWMVSTEVMRQLLPAWPRNFWQKHLRKVTAGKQNIIPELPRVRLDRTNLQSASIFVSSARDLNHADLGDLRRLAAEVYLERLITDLQEATLVEELKNLPSPIKMRDSTLELNWRVHYQSSQPDNDGTWNFLARYLQLPETGQGPLLEGVSKLVWGRGFLFLVASSSRLIVKARLRPLPAEPVAPEAFQEAARPLLLAPNGELLAADRTGQSCSDFCTSRGGFCAASDLLFANSCEAMRTVLFCERCERNMGSDQPAVASSRSSRSYGACLYNGDILHHPITCEAAHRETRRLCVCRDVAGVPSTTKTSEPSESTSKSSKQSNLETPEPTTESSSTLAAEAAETTLKQSKEPTTESSSTLAAEAAETTLKQSKEKSSSDMVSADVDAASFARTKAVDGNQTLGRSAVNRSRPS